MLRGARGCDGQNVAARRRTTVTAPRCSGIPSSRQSRSTPERVSIAKLRAVHAATHPAGARATRRRAVGSYPCSVTELRVTVPEETAKRLAREAADRGPLPRTSRPRCSTSTRLHRGSDRFPSSPCSRRRRAPSRWPRPNAVSKTAKTKASDDSRRRHRAARGRGHPARPDHDRCVTFFEEVSEPLVIPQLVITEAAHLVDRILSASAEASCIRELADAVVSFHCNDPRDLHRMADLMDTYADLPLGTVDAAVIATAERLRRHQDRHPWTAGTSPSCGRPTFLPSSFFLNDAPGGVQLRESARWPTASPRRAVCWHAPTAEDTRRSTTECAPQR